MEHSVISNECVTLLIHNGESIDKKSAEDIVRRALSARGLGPWHGMDISLFPGKDDTLLIALPLSVCSVSIAGYALPFIKEYFTD